MSMPVTAFRTSLTVALLTLFFACTPTLMLRAQSTNASLKGTVQDPTGAVIPELT